MMKELHQRTKKLSVPETEMQLHNGWAPASWQGTQDGRSQETHRDGPEATY